MKAAISAQQGDVDSLVDPRFGRGAWLIVADLESGKWTVVDNRETARSNGGAGAQAVTAVVDQGVECVVTGNVGPNAHKALVAAGVAIYRAGNGVTVREAIRSLHDQELDEVVAPTVAGHWA